MRYYVQLAAALPIGSGPIESGGNQVIAARLRQAAMLWSLEGVRAVAAVGEKGGR